MKRIAVIGGGSWGTALASLLGVNGWDVVVWSYERDVAVALGERHENPKYLPGITLPQSVRGTSDLAEAVASAELVVAANPSHVTRDVMTRAAPLLPRATPVVSATKGIEEGSLLTMNGIALATANAATLAASLAVTLAAYAYRIRVEDAMLVAALGEPYDAYRRQVRALVPFVW